MQMTNIGTSYSPRTPGGRILCLGVSIYAAAMFGYLTAILASMFIDREAKDPTSEVPSQTSIQRLHEEVTALRVLVEEALSRLPPAKGPPHPAQPTPLAKIRKPG